MAAITENSTVRIGLVLTLAGFAVSAIWWAAALSANFKTLSDRVGAVIQDHEFRLRVLEKSKTGVLEKGD